jgi:uncharacterized membrane protein
LRLLGLLGLQAPPTSSRQVRRWYSPTSIARSFAIRPRLYLCASLGGAAAVLLPGGLSASVREAVAWDISALVYLSFTFRIMLRCTGEMVRARAARQDDSGLVILVLILLAITASFTSIAGLLNESSTQGPRVLQLALAGSTLLLSWTVTQVVFTLHYAHEFYRPSDDRSSVVGGLDFQGGNSPDYWDFFYFATSIGAASQTSDVSIRPSRSAG